MKKTQTSQEKELLKAAKGGRVALLNYVVANLFNGVTEQDVIRQHGTGFYRGDAEIPKAEIDALVADARQVLGTRLWAELYNSIRLEANKKMYLSSQTIDDMVFGKAALWVMEIIKLKLEKLSRLK